MSRYLSVLFCFFFYLLSLSLQAEESKPVTLQVSPDFLTKICTPPLFKNLKVVWRGIKDKRGEKALGVETLRNKNPSFLISNPSLEIVFNQTLKDLFTKCGMQFSNQEGEFELSGEIQEFYATTDKKLITAKGIGKSKLHFFMVRPSRKKTIEIGYELESKKTRDKKLTQLAQMLNELFVKTLEQIPNTKQFQENE